MRWLLSLTLLGSAALLFFVQPMFSRALLPLYGGAPAVWSTCLVLFQATLLLGYLFAHLTAGWRRFHGVGLALHLALVWGGLLPLWSAPATRTLASGGDASPALVIARAFASTIGLALLALSATTPALQRWLARALRADPARQHRTYTLYAVSNLGSFGALLAYPLIAEPLLALSSQRRLWLAAYVVFAALVSACAVITWRAVARLEAAPEGATGPGGAVDPAAARAEPGPADAGPPSRIALRLRWLALSFVPSGLLVGATSHITTDVAAMPLLWVVPLGLYLATFVLVFSASRRAARWRGWMLEAQSLLVLPVVALFVLGAHTPLVVAFPLHLGVLFASALVCHAELYRSRPPVSRLTAFYLWIALGGALGGVFAGLLAPWLLQTAIEYPLLVIAACLACPAAARPLGGRAKLLWMALCITVALLLVPTALATPAREVKLLVASLTVVLLASAAGALLLHHLRTRARVALVLGALLAGGLLDASARRPVLLRQRSFFGTLRVVTTADHRYRLLQHGTIRHGAQRATAGGGADARPEPLTYFGRSGPVGDLFTTLQRQRPAIVSAVFGLGVGTLAAYVRPTDAMTFYELDPNVAGVARRREWFSYVASCPGEVRIVIGDARVKLREAADGSLDLLVQDAFSSDAIPTHLLTREAFALYLRKLKQPSGLLAFNITNRGVDLEPLLAAMIDDQRLSALIRRHRQGDAGVDRSRQLYPSVWVVAARRAADLAQLRRSTLWRPLRRRGATRPWTDDYASVLPFIKPL